MKRLCLYLVVLLGGFLLIGAPGCTSDPNVEGAKLDIKNKDYDRAYENITKALETDPDNVEAHELKGQILQIQAFATSDAEQHGALLEEMMTAYHRCVELDPTRNATVENQLKIAYFNEFNRGIQAFNRGEQAQDEKKQAELNAAASYFGNAAMMFPDSSNAYINQAYAYFGSGQSEMAIEPFEMAIEKGDTSEDTFVRLATLYQTYEQHDKAISLLEKAYDLYPENEDIRSQLMNAYNMAGQGDRAVQMYEKAVDQEPNNKLYRYNYGSLLLELENYDDAIVQLMAATEIDPNYANAQYNLGAAYVNKAVVVNEEVTTMDDELREKRSQMSEDEIKQVEAKMDERAQERRSLFESAIEPLEKAKELTEAEGGDAASLSGICQALFQSYAQTGQTDKAETVSDCAGYELN
ncbi:MAG: tetratricopeptide repeat protein [Bacteroidetes bacterium]|nr:tetratricopeptide repeat protein [Bacteroidota bacterium]